MKMMKTLGVITALLMSLGGAYGAVKPVKPVGKPAPKPVKPSVVAPQKPSALFPASEDLRSGFIDKTGKVILSGFEEVGDFNEGLAPVGSNYLYGFIDVTGKLVIPMQHHGVVKFSEGLAAVYDGHGLWGYVDKTDTMVLKPQYHWANPFSEGLAAVQIDGKFGLIDKKGTVVVPPSYDSMGVMSEGLAAVKQGDKCGFIDKTGAVVITPQFDKVGPFSSGLAPALSEGQWGFIDKTGKWVIQPKYATAESFSEGLAVVGTPTREMLKNEQGRVFKIENYNILGYIDTTGKEVIPLIYRSAGSFTEGLAPVRNKDGFAFIDKTGKVALSSPFGQSTGSFHNGLARTEFGQRYGYINETGKMVIPEQFTEAQAFSEGLAAVEYSKYGPYGYIDASGRTVVKPQFTMALDFYKGLARVRGELNWGIIDKTGKVVLDQRFGEIGWITDKVIAVQPPFATAKPLWGFYDRSGQPILDCQFQSAVFLGDSQAVVKKDGKWGVVDAAGKLIVPNEYDDAGWLFSEGLLPVKKDGKFGFIDATGKPAIEPQYDAVGGFMPEKLCPVKVAGKWGFIDPANKMVITPQFDETVCFSEGLAAVQVGERWGFIDKTGSYVVKPQYDLASNFNCGLAAVQVGEKWGYVDKTGKLAIPAKFDRAPDFNNNLAQVRIGNQNSYINTTGKAVWSERQYPTEVKKGPAPSTATVQIDSDGVRVVRVKVAADQLMQKRTDWQEMLKTRMQAVSDLMEKTFKVKLVVTAVVPWTTPEFKEKDDPDVYGDVIYNKLVADVPMDDSEIVIGFTGQTSRSTTLAFTHTYFEHVIVYDPDNGAAEVEPRIVRTIAHEICHDFGAFHVKPESSIMNAILLNGDEQTTFDEDTIHQVDLMHDYDFAKGMDSLTEDKIKQAEAIYAVGHAPDVPFPVAKSHMYRGITRVENGDIAGGIQDYREAIRLDGVWLDFAHVYYLGKILLGDGQTVLGIETLRMCPPLKTDPEEAGMYHNYLATDLADQMGKDADFLTCREQARPKLGDIYQRYMLTRISPDEVISEYRAAIQARPKEASYQSKLGAVLLDCGRLDEALAAFQEAAKLEPENTYYQSQVETVKTQMGEQGK